MPFSKAGNHLSKTYKYLGTFRALVCSLCSKIFAQGISPEYFRSSKSQWDWVNDEHQTHSQHLTGNTMFKSRKTAKSKSGYLTAPILTTRYALNRAHFLSVVSICTVERKLIGNKSFFSSEYTFKL